MDSIEPIFLCALLNRTNGKITPQQVKAKELAIYNMPFDISQPVDFVFNAIDNLSELAEHANLALTPQQTMLDLAYLIFAKQSITSFHTISVLGTESRSLRALRKQC